MGSLWIKVKSCLHIFVWLSYQFFHRQLVPIEVTSDEINVTLSVAHWNKY